MSAPLLLAPLLLLLAHVAWTDLVDRRIDNRAVAALLALYPAQLLVTGQPEPWYGGPLAGVLLLAAGVAAWRAGLVGGGDVKLAAVLATLVGIRDLLELLLVTGLVGGVLALVLLTLGRGGWMVAPVVSRLLPEPFGTRALRLLTPATTSVPYGVALAAGGLWCTLARLAR